MRKLNDQFMLALQNGSLHNLLETVKRDDTLCLEIRENYINIYYRGGNMFRITQKNNQYDFFFDFSYCKHKNQPSKYESIIHKEIANKNELDCIPFIKAEMDLWFYEHPKLEREHQQLILRDNNNSSISNDTDYYIADIEYADATIGSRFDLLGIKWLSDTASRKNTNNITLAAMELKYGDSAITGTAGIQKHFLDMEKFFLDEKIIDALYNDVQTVFNQKIELGLIRDISKTITIDKSQKPEFILLFANHNPESNILVRELETALKEHPQLLDKVDIKIAKASCIGYGLYVHHMLNIPEFINIEKNRNPSKIIL